MFLRALGNRGIGQRILDTSFQGISGMIASIILKFEFACLVDSNKISEELLMDVLNMFRGFKKDWLNAFMTDPSVATELADLQALRYERQYDVIKWYFLLVNLLML